MAIRLAFSTYGSHSGNTPVTVLHGLFGSKQNWRSLAGKLAKELNRLVYVLDARNHGESPHSSSITYKLMSRDALAFCKEQGLKRTVLIGHSMGGKTAMATALTHPEIVEGLVIVDVAPCRAPGTGESVDIITHLKELDIGSLESRREANDLLIDKIPDFTTRQFLLTNLVSDGLTGKFYWKVNLGAIEKNLHHLKGFPQFHSNFSGPALFMGGSNSDYISATEVPEIRRLFPSAVVRHIPGAGHWPHYEKPDEFLRLVVEFFANTNDTTS